MYQRQVTFKEAVERALKVNYCNFSGRASRSEFWWFQLFAFILGIVVEIVFCWNQNVMSVASAVVGLALLLPNLGLDVRRLHDIGKSGWWIFISLVPIVGWILLLVWYCKDSQMEPNEYGPGPNVVDSTI
ncbi:MAG: DUF805 domain-containing protein, partial [Muribaculaceae bacterium]|nr:DUF805 domain-containing protein [Muribaculaceae bacterium]